NRFVGADESDFQLRWRLRVAKVKRAEARDTETDIDMRAAVGEFKIRLLKKIEPHVENRSSMSGSDSASFCNSAALPNSGSSDSHCLSLIPIGVSNVRSSPKRIGGGAFAKRSAFGRR